MRIAVIGNFDKEISPASSGGTEVFTYSLSEELAKRDEVSEVIVHGVGKNHFSHKKIQFHPILPQATREFVTNHPVLSKLYEERSDFLTDFQSNLALTSFMDFFNEKYDIIHNNATSSVLNTLISLIKSPVVTTLHTNVNSPSILIPYELGSFKNAVNNYFVPIGNHQRAFAEKHRIHLDFTATIYNGILTENFPFQGQTTNQESGFWLGRASRKHNKGLQEAITTAETAKTPVIIATRVDDADYYAEVAPLAKKYAQILTEPLTIAERVVHYQHASYFLYPIQWEEPFGLVFIEAMSCGTPVIAFAKGSVPEIIEDGKTGFIVNPSDDDIRGNFIVKKTGIDGLHEAIKRLQSLSATEYKTMRENCRQHVEEKFTIQKMVDGYIALYQKLLAK